ncbi:MAG: hypothetical protein KME26_15695 [Oscillatoria princeps RMCB-10]|nr:hypothetical protein [Oscillatoria princeps RMCB-10]
MRVKPARFSPRTGRCEKVLSLPSLQLPVAPCRLRQIAASIPPLPGDI